MTSSPPHRNLPIAVVLILAPIVALLLKMVSFGWLLVLFLLGPVVVFAAGYVVQIVVAAQGFLSRNDLFGEARGRATIAAWVTSLGFLLLGLSLSDGGDSGSASTLQILLGVNGPNEAQIHATTDGITFALALVSAVAWLGGWVWLVIEWIGAQARRRKSQLRMGV